MTDTISPSVNGKSPGVSRRVLVKSAPKHQDVPAWAYFYARVLPIEPRASWVHAEMQLHQRMPKSLHGGHPLTAADLAQMVKMRPQTVGRILRRLESDGMAVRRGQGWWAIVPRGSRWTMCEVMCLQRITRLLPCGPGLALWCHICELHWNGGCYASVEYLGKLVGLSERQARNVLRQLEAAGMIRVHQQPDDHPVAQFRRMDGRTNIYVPRRWIWVCPCRCGLTSDDGS